jgi:hypothetical protein
MGFSLSTVLIMTSCPAGVDGWSDGVEHFVQVRHEVGFVEDDHSAGVAAAAGGRKGFGLAAVGEHEVVGAALHDGAHLHPGGEVFVHLDEAREQFDAFIVALGHQHDVGRRMEEHHPECVGQREPGHTKLPCLQHDDVAVRGDLGQRFLLRRPQLERYPLAHGRVVNRHMCARNSLGSTGTSTIRSSHPSYATQRPYDRKSVITFAQRRRGAEKRREMLDELPLLFLCEPLPLYASASKNASS